jgi:hypothetical protein
MRIGRMWVGLALSCLLALAACGGDDDDDDVGGEGEGECGPAPGGDCCTCDDACGEWVCATPEDNAVDCPEQGGPGVPCGREATCEYCIEGTAARFECTGGALSLIDACGG